MSPLECGTQAARLEQITLHHLDAALLERGGRRARRVASDNTNCVLARSQQGVHNSAALRTGTAYDCDGLFDHVRLFSVGVAEPATDVPSFLSSSISVARSLFESALAAASIAALCPANILVACFSPAGVNNTVDRILKIDCELVRFADRRFSAAVCAGREQWSAPQ